jgi:NAD(P)-dependent dehydrogenase (short-subunit alcohol dehydrogenase family)/acyl dehydratase
MKKIAVGDCFEVSRTISSADVDSFAKMTGDKNPVHFDDSYARTLSYQHRIAHGMLTTSFLSEIVGERFPGNGAVICEQTIKYPKPVYVGDTLSYQVSCRHISKVEDTVILAVCVLNGKGEKVITGELMVTVRQPIKENKAIMSTTQNLPIIIIGGSGGIGQAAAKALKKAKRPLILTYLTAGSEALQDLNKLPDEGMLDLYQLDLSNSEQIQEFCRYVENKYGSVYGIVHTGAPRINSANLLEVEWGDIAHNLDVQVKGFLELVQKITPFMIKNKNGSIVVLLSAVLDMAPHPEWLAYTIAKSALKALMKNMAIALGQHNIRVNAVSPGMTMTSYIDNIPERYKKLQRATTPLNRLADPDDIASLINYLMSDDNKHITGETISVCGGLAVR